MFKDERFKTTITGTRFSDANNSETLDFRLDIEIPVADWAKVHPVIGDLVRAVAGEGCGLGHMHFMQELPVYDLQFAPQSEDLGDAEYRTDISGVEFANRLQVVRRTEKEDGETDETFFLLLRTKLPRTARHTTFVQENHGVQIWCRFIESQRELPLDEKGEKEECNKEQATA